MSSTTYRLLVAEASSPSATTVYTLPLEKTLNEIASKIQGNYIYPDDMDFYPPPLRFYTLANPALRSTGNKFVEVQDHHLTGKGFDEMAKGGFAEWDVTETEVRGKCVFVKVFAVGSPSELKGIA